MYESYFGLSGKPFQLTPDARFFFRSVGHKRAVAYMRYGLQQEQGFIVVTGDVGTGKTTLVHNLFKEIENQAVVAAKIVSTNVKDVDLLRLIAAEFDIPFERSSKAALLHQLESFFRACRDEGKRVLLVIDEAQNLPRSALEELRMLSNFEYMGLPLVQSFLLGQREFRAIMRAPGLEQLRQRVIAAYHLKPLSETEVRAYIEHRLRKVGWTDDPSIEDGVFRRVFEATGGVPRRINTLFDRILLNCYLDEAHSITNRMADAVCSEVEVEQAEQFEEEDAPHEAPPTSPQVEAVAEPAPREQALKAEIVELQERLATMQATVDHLNARLAEEQSPRLAQPVYLDQTIEGTTRRFPFWTSAFLGLLGLLVIIGIGGGLWLWMR